MKYNNTFSIGILVIAVVFCLLSYRSCSEYKEKYETNSVQIKTLQDLLKAKKESLSENQTTILVEKDTFEIQSLNKEIEHLQALVKKLQSIQKPKIITKVDTIIKEVIIKADDNIREAFYDFNGWAYGSIISYRDSTGISINIKNDLSIVHKKDKKGSYVEVFDKNPYTTTEAIRSYYKLNNKKPIIKRWGVGPNLSYGINYKGDFLPYVGIGIQYNLIHF
ncbi:hypothetical protein CGC56_00830 [Capnocytophaga canimorsus]|uniref:DUF6808 domain-containing protein n=1 Tax=Capnocytophaga canimorsus TaxID=28188 RepID=A0A250G3M7_9FLAO|nr:OmpH family outer membrane protein [Capnocytophaga canimorsus]ATA90846.1 hypothetical protein CGC56_00830 [Capnocytophaga canimorsus]